VPRAFASYAALIALAASTAGCSDGHSRSSKRSGDLTGTITAVLKPSARGLHIYDARQIVNTTIASGDIDRSSIRVEPLSGGRASLYVGFNARGRRKFCRLTRALAHRGARLHRHQYFVIEVSGRDLERPWIDYKTSPDGLCGTPGFELDNMETRTARTVARMIRTP
jgi:hypothetical protein